MASTYSALKIQLMATGENSGTWGNVTNDNLGLLLKKQSQNRRMSPFRVPMFP